MLRPTFGDILKVLERPVAELFMWAQKDLAVHPQCSVIGAPIAAGSELYLDLQKTYIKR